MNRNISQLAAMLTLTAAFAVLSFTDNLMTNADDSNDLQTADTTAEVTSSEVQTSYVPVIYSEPSSESYTQTTTVSETVSETISQTVSETEITTTVTSFLAQSAKKELGTYTSDFTPLTSSELATLYTDGIVIVGDSIASGYKVYNRLPEKQVMAVGSLGARNIHDFKVTLNGAEYAVADSIKILKPKYICMSMGMNDLNIGTKDEFIQNYTNNINELLEVSPDSVFIIMAITPISATSTHSTNYIIDTYNEALKQMVEERNDIPIYYVNAAQTLKNEWNSLSTSYSGGDGIHLAPASYDTMLTYLLGALSEIDSSYTNKITYSTETEVPSWTQEETTETEDLY
jgi:lysophospholipase L1-like esterase